MLLGSKKVVCLQPLKTAGLLEVEVHKVILIIKI